MRFANSIGGYCAGVALLALAATGGCGGGGEAAATPGQPLTYEAGFADDFFVPDTTVPVTLRYETGSGCFVVTGMGKSWTPLWPEGTKGTSEGGVTGVDYPGFGAIAEGGTVRAMGAGWAQPLTDDLLPAELLNGCSAPDGVLVVTAILGTA